MPFEQADLLFRTSKEYGVPISAAEFTNEPNLIALSGLPQGYTAADHARDHDLFGAWLKENYPECLFVGPCTVGDINLFGSLEGAGGGMAAGFEMVTTEQLLGDYKSPWMCSVTIITTVFPSAVRPWAAIGPMKPFSPSSIWK